MGKKFEESDQCAEIPLEERKRSFSGKDISLREFLHAGAGLAAVASGINLTPGHVLAQTQDDPAMYGKLVADPELYYPGDKYADWIGLNVFANLKNPHVSENKKFGDLATKIYEEMRKSHPQKPMMISAFGRQDHTLDEKSLGTLRGIFRDPYWIMAK